MLVVTDEIRKEFMDYLKTIQGYKSEMEEIKESIKETTESFEAKIKALNNGGAYTKKELSVTWKLIEQHAKDEEKKEKEDLLYEEFVKPFLNK